MAELPPGFVRNKQPAAAAPAGGGGLPPGFVRNRQPEPNRVTSSPAFAKASPSDRDAAPVETAALLARRRGELNDIAMTAGSELVRTPAHLAGLPSAALGAAETVGTAIGDAARWVTGKEPRAEGPAPDPLGLRTVQEALPTSEGIRRDVSNVTGVSLHDPTTTPGKVAGVVTDLVAGGRGLRTGVLKPREGLPDFVPMATKPRNPVIEGAIKRAREEAGNTGKQLAQTLPPQIKAILADPAQMARFSPAERAIMRDVARNGWTQAAAVQLGKIPNSAIAIAILGRSAALAVGAGKLARHTTAKNIRILNGIIGGEAEAAPAAVRTAPAAAPAAARAVPAAPPTVPPSPTAILEAAAQRKAAAAERAALDRPPARPPPEPVAPVPAAEAPPVPANPAAKLDAIAETPPAAAAPITPAQRLDWAGERQANWDRTNPQFDFGNFRPPTKGGRKVAPAATPKPAPAAARSPPPEPPMPSRPAAAAPSPAATMDRIARGEKVMPPRKPKAAGTRVDENTTILNPDWKPTPFKVRQLHDEGPVEILNPDWKPTTKAAAPVRPQTVNELGDWLAEASDRARTAWKTKKISLDEYQATIKRLRQQVKSANLPAEDERQLFDQWHWREARG